MDSAKPVCYTIYCHIHTDSGRRYVGLTSQTVEKRWKNHVHAAKSANGKNCFHFANAIRKYGKDAFIHEVLEVCLDLDQANLAEEWWIRKLDSRNPLKGFNLKQGGSHTPHPIKNPWDRPGYREKHMNDIASCLTPEARAKMTATHRSLEFQAKRSQISKKFQSNPEYRARQSIIAQQSHARPEVREKLSTASRGRKPKPISEETRKKLRDASSNKHHSEETLKRIGKALSNKNKHVIWGGRIVGLECHAHGPVDDFLITKWPNGNTRVVCRLCAREVDKRRKDRKRTARGFPILGPPGHRFSQTSLTSDSSMSLSGSK